MSLPIAKATPAPGAPASKSGSWNTVSSKKSRSRNSGSKGDTSTTTGGKFQGLNQEELKGIVIDHSIEHKMPISQQFEKFRQAVIVVAGKMNPDLGPTIRMLKIKPESDYSVKMPSKADFTDPDGSENPLKKELLSKAWIAENTERTKAYRRYIDDLKKMFAVICGQLSPGIIERLQAISEWQDMQWDCDTIKLLYHLKEICYRDNESKVHRAVDALSKIKKFVSTYQENKDVIRFAEDVKMRHDVLKASGLQIRSRELIEYVLERSFGGKAYNDYLKLPDVEKKPIHTAVDNLLIATQIIEGSNRKLNRHVASALRDNFTLGQDPYPLTPNAAIDILIRYSVTDKKSSRTESSSNNSSSKSDKTSTESKKSDEKETNATAFVTDGNEKPATPAETEKTAEIQEAKVLINKGIARGEQFGEFDDEFCFITFNATDWDDVPDLVERMDPYPDSDDESTASLDTSAYESFWGTDIPESPNNNRSDPLIDLEENTTDAYDDWEEYSPSESKEWETTKLKEWTPSKLKEWEAKECTTLQDKIPEGGEISYSPAVEHLFAQRQGRVDPYWLLLDSQATCNIIANRALLRNIRKHPDGKQIDIHCNAGNVTSTEIGDFPGFGTVWFLPSGIANILSLALVSDMYRVTIDTAITQAFFVHRGDGSTRRFERMDCNLYASDYKAQSANVFAIATVEGRKEFFSERDITKARKARKIQETIGFPSNRDFLKMIDKKQILNCPISRQDVLNAIEIFGVNTNIIKGKTVRRQPQHTDSSLHPVPAKILQRYKDVTIAVDVFTINGIKFFHSVSRHLCFRTTKAIQHANKSTLLNCIEAIQGVYKSRGFRLQQIYADNEFECLRDDLYKLNESITLHCVPRNCHEPYVERDNRTTKERVRCTFAAVPFKRLPPRMIIEMVQGVNFWLNNWCSKGGVSKTMSPREIMTGMQLDYNKHAKFQFGDYVLGHEEGGNNTMEPRAREAIYLRPTGNVQGGMYLLDLETGKRIHRLNATGAHTTDTVIRRVEEIARQQNAQPGITFGDSQGHTTVHDIDDSSEVNDGEDASYNNDEESVDTALTGVTNASEVTAQTSENEVIVVETVTEEEEQHEESENVSHSEDQNSQVSDTAGDETEPAEDAPPQVEADGANPTDDDPNESNDNNEEPVARRPGLRPSVRRTHNKFGAEDGFTESTVHRSFFSAGFTKAMHQLEQDHEAVALVSSALEQYNNLDASLVTKQFGVKKGLEMFGDAGVEAILKELRQLNDRNVVSPLHPRELTHDQVRKALPYLMFLKRKRCGKIKGRGCADGRPQREFISKEDASSPTVSLYALMLSCVIDAIEGRDVATADIPGAFLQTDLPEGEDVYIRLDGTMAELLAQIDPQKYKPCIVNRGGKKVIFTKANKAIYGTLRASLLFWQKLTGKLKEWGFEANPYDMCTVNKMVKGKQLTIVWHVDDLKISHKDPTVVTDILVKLNAEFGQISPLTVTRGKIHEYVGMTIDYTDTGRVKISMFDYIADILSELPEFLVDERITTSPAGDHLFRVSEEAEKVNMTMQDTFHTYVAKLLFVAKRARPDIQTAIAFLCTRVQAPDTDDIKKLRRVISYLRSTIFLPLVLGWDGSGNTYWYVDASFAVHADMRSHTGAVMTMGQGAILSMSTKQKLNTKSSTEAEVVGADDALPFNLWCYYFLQWQGYHAAGCNPINGNNPSQPVTGEKNILYQDNTSAMRLEMNGKASSSKRTRHINIRFFMITDKVKSGEITIAYCPTDDMVADVFTKPLQGSKFRKFRNMVLGITDADYMSYQADYERAKRKTTNA